jgi:hypothetical protein
MVPDFLRIPRTAAPSKRRFALPLVLLTGLLLLALAASSAQALVVHNYLCQITGQGSASTSPSECDTNPSSTENPAVPGGRLSGLNDMTLDSGSLWLAEQIEGTSTYRVNHFAAAGRFESQFPTPPGFRSFEGIAVGHSTGEPQVYVGARRETGEEEEEVAVFDPAGNLLGTWSGGDTPAGMLGLPGPDRLRSLAVDASTSPTDWAAGDVYVATASTSTGGGGVVDVFKPKPGGGEEYVTQLTGTEPAVPFGNPETVAVDSANGNVFVVDAAINAVDVFEPTTSGEYAFVRQVTGTSSGPFGRISSLAIDSASGELYVSEAERGGLDQFDSSGSYLGRLTGADTPAASFKPASIAVDPTSHRLFVGSGGPSGVIDVFGPDLIVPDVETEPASELKPNEATLGGTVNPDSAGQATCQFAWGTTAALEEAPLPCEAAVPDGNIPAPVAAKLTGLQPDTTYFFRLQAENSGGVLNPGEPGQTKQFTTTGPGIHSTSVSAVSAESATLEATIDPNNSPATYYFQYGVDTGYGTDVPAPPGASIGSGKGDVEVSRHLQGLLAGTVYHYRVVVVSELSTGNFETFDGPDRAFTTQPLAAGPTPPDGRAWELVSPPDKHGTLIRPILEELAQASVSGEAMTYVALGPTEAEPQGDGNGVQILSTRGPRGWSSQDIAIAHELPSQVSIGQGSEYKFFSSDLSQAIVQPMGEFTPQPTELPPYATERTVYLRDNATGTYRALVTPANTPPGTKLFNGDPTGQAIFGNVQFVGASPDLNHVILRSSVALTSDPAPQGGVYEWAEGQLQLVSLLPASEGGGAAAEADLGTNQHQIAWHAVSPDGSRVIWSGSSGLYLRDTNPLSSGDPEAQTTTKIEATTSFQTAASSEAVKVFLAGPDASEDGSYVYFTSAAVLSGEQRNSHGDKAQAGATNVYLSHAGTTTFIATLGADGPDFGMGLNKRTSRVSPDGRWFAFMSERPLTGYDNRDAVSGARDEEVFLYHAPASSGEAGTLLCASCNPTGARPRGVKYRGGEGMPLAGGDRVWEESQWIAANIPGWTAYKTDHALHQSRYLSDSGRLFFNSSDALVPSDTNGNEDVYQYEPPGIGDCTEQNPAFSPAAEGCIGLISSGTSGEESAFLDASENGNDVFFLTSARLSSQDVDTSLDVYDAHVCSADSPCPPPPPAPAPACEGDACQQPAEAPNDPTPGSLTFHGAGNLHEEPATKPRCRKGKVRAHGKCVAKKHHKAKHKRATSHKRGGGR